MRKSLEPLILTAMVVVFFARFLFTDSIALLNDLCFFSYPGHLFSCKCFAQGALPLWNPFRGCGEPFLADIQRAVLYPVNLIYLLLPTARATIIPTVAHVLLAGVGVYGLSRTWGVFRIGSLLAAVVFAFNSFTITRVGYPAALGSLAWYPVIVWAFALWLRHRKRGYLLGTSGAFCLQFLAGYPEAAFYTAWSLAFYALSVGYHEWRTRRKLLSFASPFLGLIVVGVLAVLLSMAQFLPTWKAMQLSGRSVSLDPHLDQASLHPLAGLTLLVPSIYGAPDFAGTYWAPSCKIYSVGAFYVGVPVVVVFVTVGLLRLLGVRRAAQEPELPDSIVRARVPWLWTLVVFFSLYAMGHYTPLFPFLWKSIGLLQRFHFPPKSLMCVVLSLSCLAGIGLDWAVHCERPALQGTHLWRRLLLRWGAISVFVALTVFVAACLVNEGRLGRTLLTRFFNLPSPQSSTYKAIPWALLLRDSLKLPVVALLSVFLLRTCVFGSRMKRGAAWLVVFVAFGDLLISNSFLLPSGPADTLDRPSAHLNDFRPTGKMVRFYGREDIAKVKRAPSDAVLPKGVATQTHPPPDAAAFGGSGLAQLWRLLRDFLYWDWPVVDEAYNVHSPGTFQPADAGIVLRLLLVPQAPMEVKERLLAMVNCQRLVRYLPGHPPAVRTTALPEPLPRAYIVGGVRVLAEPNDVLRQLAAGRFDPREVAFIDRSSAGDDAFVDLKPGRVAHHLRRIEYGVNRLAIEVESHTKGVLVVSDSHYPGWVATVNGEETPIYKVNYAFRGVRVPAGTSKIEMAYRPMSIQIGVAVSLATLVLMLVLLIPRTMIKLPHWLQRSPRSGSSCGLVLACLVTVACTTRAVASSPASQDVGGRALDPGNVAPAEVIGLVCVHDAKSLRRELTNVAGYGMVQRSPWLRAKIKRVVGAAELALALNAGVPLWEFVERHVERATFLVFDVPEGSGKGIAGYAVVLDLGPNVDLADKLLRDRIRPRLRLLTPRGKRAERKVAGVSVEVYQPSAFGQVAMARAEHLLVLGWPACVEQVVRTIQGRHVRLSELPAYQRIRRTTAKGGDGCVSFYIDTEPLDWKRRRRARTAEQTQAERLLGFGGLLAVGGSSVGCDNLVTSRVLYAMKRSRTGILGALASAPHVELTGARFVPADYDALCMFDVGDGAAITQRFWSMVAPQNRPLANSLLGFNRAAGQFGVNIHRDLVLRMAGDCFLAVKASGARELGSGSWRETLLAFQPLLGMKVREPEAIMKAWRTLAEAGMVAAQGVRWETERVGRQAVHVLRAHGEPILGIEFCLAFIQDTMLVALSFKTMAEALRAVSAGKALAGNTKFQRVRSNLSGACSLMLFVDPAKLAEGLFPPTAPTTTQAITASTSQAFLSDLAAPLGRTEGLARGIMECLQDHPGLGLTARGCPEGILMESCSPLAEPVFANLPLLFAHFTDMRWRGTTLDVTWRRLRQTGRALECHAAKHRALPDDLAALAPYYLVAVPADPFAKGRPLTYVRSPTGENWLLASVGPDGRPDIGAKGFDLDGFLKQVRSTDPADTAQAKRMLHRFRADRYPDEDHQQDEGDMAIWQE